MLLLAALFLTATCLVICGCTLIGRMMTKRLAGVTGEVNAEVDGKEREDRQLSLHLAERVCNGRPLDEAIDQWQAERARLLSVGKAEDPWRWGADDLAKWMQQEVRARSEDLRRQQFVMTVWTVVGIVLVTGLAGLGGYHYLSAAPAGLPSAAGLSASPQFTYPPSIDPADGTSSVAGSTTSLPAMSSSAAVPPNDATPVTTLMP